MTPRRLRSRVLASTILTTLVGAVVALAAAGPASSQPGSQPVRRLVVVSDSIAAGARGAIESAFSDGGWSLTFDAAQNRTTYAAPAVIESHRAELTDSLVLSLGANDGADAGTFRARVDAVMAAVADVPRVYWLNLNEVRDGYAAANQVLAAAAERYPNLTVLDWNSVAGSSAGLTAPDRLHLSGAGATAMAELVGDAVRAGPAPVAEAAPPSTQPAPAPAAAPTVPAPTTAPATVPTPTTTAPGTTASETAAPVPAGTGDTDVGGRRSGWRSLAGWTVGGFAAVVALLAIAGMCVGVWSLWTTRGSSPSGTGIRPVNHPAVRSRQRAERIAAARRAAADAVTSTHKS